MRCTDATLHDYASPMSSTGVLFLVHRFHSISFTRAQGIPKHKIGFGREKDGRVGERLVEGGGGHGAFALTPCVLLMLAADRALTTHPHHPPTQPVPLSPCSATQGAVGIHQRPVRHYPYLPVRAHGSDGPLGGLQPAHRLHPHASGPAGQACVCASSLYTQRLLRAAGDFPWRICPDVLGFCQ
jgi:hypothetical protein